MTWTIRCPEVVEELWEFAFDRAATPGEDRLPAAIAEHLRCCPPCREEASVLREQAVKVRDTVCPEPSEESVARVHRAAMRRIQTAREDATRRRVWLRRSLVAASLAGAAASLMFAALWWVHDDVGPGLVAGRVPESEIGRPPSFASSTSLRASAGRQGPALQQVPVASAATPEEEKPRRIITHLSFPERKLQVVWIFDRDFRLN